MQWTSNIKLYDDLLSNGIYVVTVIMNDIHNLPVNRFMKKHANKNGTISNSRVSGNYGNDSSGYMNPTENKAVYFAI